MSCQKKNCNWNCKQYLKKEEYRLAKKKHPLIDNPTEKWECDEEFEKTCPDFKPYPPRLTEKEFAEKQKEILNGVPKEFRSVLSAMAWEQGHSAGYEEVINYLSGFVSELRQPINDFMERMRNECR